MRANDLPFSTVGTTGIFPLLAERLATRPRAVGDANGELAPGTPVPTAPRTRPASIGAPAGRGVHVDLSLYEESRWALVRAGLWMRAGFIGACALAAGLVLLKDGTDPALALALVTGGATLAPLAWRRGWEILSRDEAAASAAPPAGVNPTADSAATPATH